MSFWENIKSLFKKRKSTLLIISAGIIAISLSALTILKKEEAKLNSYIVKAEKRIREIEKQLPPKGLKLDKSEKEEVHEKQEQINELLKEKEELKKKEEIIKASENEIQSLLNKLLEIENFLNEKQWADVPILMSPAELRDYYENLLKIVDLIVRFSGKDIELFNEITESKHEDSEFKQILPDWIVDRYSSTLEDIGKEFTKHAEKNRSNFLEAVYQVVINRFSESIPLVSRIKKRSLDEYFNVIKKLVMLAKSKELRDKLMPYTDQINKVNEKLVRYESEYDAFLVESKARLEQLKKEARQIAGLDIKD